MHAYNVVFDTVFINNLEAENCVSVFALEYPFSSPVVLYGVSSQ